MYGAQTTLRKVMDLTPFENDVEMYGAQTVDLNEDDGLMFENDVEMYGAQTILASNQIIESLRMM